MYIYISIDWVCTTILTFVLAGVSGMNIKTSFFFREACFFYTCSAPASWSQRSFPSSKGLKQPNSWVICSPLFFFKLGFIISGGWRFRGGFVIPQCWLFLTTCRIGFSRFKCLMELGFPNSHVVWLSQGKELELHERR